MKWPWVTRKRFEALQDTLDRLWDVFAEDSRTLKELRQELTSVHYELAWYRQTYEGPGTRQAMRDHYRALID